MIASVEQIEALKPKIVVAGHKRPNARDDDPATILSATKTYIRNFDKSLSESRSAQDLVDKMTVLHGGLGNPYTVDRGTGRLRAGTGRVVMSRLATQRPCQR